MKNIQPLQLILGGCGLAALGTFLPWIKGFSEVPSLGINESRSFLGVSDAMGILILLLSGAAIASLYVKLPGKAKLLATGGLAAAGLALLLTVIQFIRILANTTTVTVPGGGSAGSSSSFGIYLTLLGALAGAYGCFLRWQKTPADPVVSGPPAGGPPPQP